MSTSLATPSSSKRAAQDLVKPGDAKRLRLPLSVYRQQILSEDDYTEALARIIRRDFFPDLDAIERPQELQQRRQALDSFADIDVQQGQWDRTASQTPAYAGETPRNPSIPVDVEDAYDGDLSLTAFLSKYTSEDNASFAEILQRNNDARRAKFEWAYEGEQRAREREQRSRDARQRLIECVQRAVEASETGEVALIEGVEPGRPGSRLLLEHGRTSILGDKASIEAAQQRVISGANAQLMIEAAADGAEPQDAALVQQDVKGKGKQVGAPRETGQDARPLNPDTSAEGWSYTTRNSFMFAPDANVSLTQASKPTTKEEEERLGMTAPKRINHANTRIARSLALSAGPVPPSPSHSNIAAAISGTPYPGRDPATPRVSGYSFVDPMPEPTAASLGEKGMKKLMTVGMLAATPIALRSKDSDEPAPVKEGPFKIPATPRREEIAHKMARNASKSLSARHGVNMPTLQGAALKRLGGNFTPGSRGIFGTPGSTRHPATEGTPRKTAEGLTSAGKALLGKTSSRGSGGISAAFATQATANEARMREKEVQKRLEQAKWE